ncbi:MAG: hypothetical protein JRJ78_09610 [Deltaproteobacteria bacterium]|nr:hypothetical protein [Deltaproteobacteria bacterium]
MKPFLQSDVSALKSVLLKHAKDAFGSQEKIEGEWRNLHYTGPPNFEKAVDQYERFLSLLKEFEVEIHWLPPNGKTGLDSIYVRDASVVCSKGIILCNMGKEQRGKEPDAQGELYEHLGLPIIGRIREGGRLEGGDVTWIDERTLAVARSYRTNDEGIRQLRSLLGDVVDEILVVPLPHWRGMDDVFHLMSIISPLDRDLALVYSPLMPIPFREALLKRGIELVEVPNEEFETMGCNVLAVAPRKAVMIDGNPKTRARLEEAGVEVSVFEGSEICSKGAGGPTCLTRPLIRQ